MARTMICQACKNPYYISDFCTTKPEDYICFVCESKGVTIKSLKQTKKVKLKTCKAGA